MDGKLAVIICHSNMGTKKNIQTQFVSIVSKVISDGIFNERFFKIKNVGKIKNVKKT